MSRFGESSSGEIEKAINNNVPRNTVNSTTSIWRQFTLFCVGKKIKLVEETSTEAAILCDWAFNMKKSNGEDYKESAVKTIWNTSAKMLQEKYFKNGFLIRSRTYSLRKRETFATQNAKFYKQPQKKER